MNSLLDRRDFFKRALGLALYPACEKPRSQGHQAMAGPVPLVLDQKSSSLNPGLQWLGLPRNWMRVEQWSCQLSTEGNEVQSWACRREPSWGPWRVQARFKQWITERQWEGETSLHGTCAEELDELRTNLGRMIKHHNPTDPRGEWRFTLVARDNWPMVVAHGVELVHQLHGQLLVVGTMHSGVTTVRMVSRVMEVCIPWNPSV